MESDYDMRIYRKIFVAITFMIILVSTAYADKWKIMKFTEDISLGMAELEQYCALHDVKIDDVLWANGISQEDIKAGLEIYLPANQIDMFSIWQNKGAWKPTALIPVTSGAAAKRLIKSQDKPVATKPEPAKTAPPVILQTAPKKDPVVTPAQVIQETSKPDKILADAQTKNEPANSIPGLMDPIIILSPNGDPATGPMRLVISGDKVEVVRLPQNAVPRRPSLADLDHTFGTTPGYLPPYYNTPAKPNDNYYPNPNVLRGKMLWPVNGAVSSGFGTRGNRRHEGIDIPMPANTPIHAARNGIVSRTGNNSTPGFRGYGNFVLLDHGNGLQTFYAHCSSVAVVQGQRIMQGQTIAYVGCTGRSTANHLHFEVRVNNVKVNPIPYLAGNSKLASYK